MIAVFRSWVATLFGAVRRRPWRALLLLAVLVALLGVAGALLGRRWAAGHHLRAAEHDLAQRDYDGALRHLERCLELRPDHAEAHFLAARTARRRKKYPDADRHLAACERLGWPADALALERTLRRAQDGDLAGIEGPLQHMVDVLDHPESLGILEALARGYTKTLQYGNAQHVLDLWLQRRPDDVQALLWRGDLNEIRVRLISALVDFRRAVELAPQDEEAHARLGGALLLEGQPSEAAGHFEFVLSRRPDHPWAGVGLARCRRAAGEVDEARDLLDRILAAHPGYGPALAERGKMELQTGAPSLAETWLRKSLSQMPYDREVKYNLADCLRQLKRKDEAATLFAEVKRAEKEQQRLEDVIERINQSPREIDPWAEAGAISLRLGLDQDGLQWYAGALRLDPWHRASREALAAYYERAGFPEIAERHRGFLTGR